MLLLSLLRWLSFPLIRFNFPLCTLSRERDGSLFLYLKAYKCAFARSEIAACARGGSFVLEDDHLDITNINKDNFIRLSWLLALVE